MGKSCLNCGYFKLSDKPPRMRGCHFEGKIVMNGATCGSWKPAHTVLDKVKARITHKAIPSRSLIL